MEQFLVLVCSLLPLLTSGETIREPILYYLQEQLPPGNLVGHFILDSKIEDTFSAEDIQQMNFTITSSMDNVVQYFTLRPNGVLATASVIDRDTICPMRDTCVLSLDIEITPLQFFQIIKINVRIEDINDNAPRFDDPVKFVSLSESVPVGSVIPLPMAYDPDSPHFGVSSYDLLIVEGPGSAEQASEQASAQGIFSLQASNLQDLLGEIYLEITEPLDREDTQHHLLEIRATDVDNHQAVLLVNITVLDVNDNMPVFSQSRYTITLPENTDPQVPLLRVTATDKDAGENGVVSYSLSQRTIQTYKDLFTVDNLTGDIYTNKELDYEEMDHYTVVVIAFDQTQNSLTGETIVSIEVTDINDNSPHITITSLGLNKTIEVQENTQGGQKLALVSVSDEDSGLGGTVTCSLNDSRFSLTQIYASDFMLETSESLDHEVSSFVDLGLTCSDGGDPGLRTAQAIRVNILDVNDNAPKFHQESYQILLDRDLGQGQAIDKVTATDNDGGENGDVVYDIVELPYKHLFSVNETSGIIYSAIPIPVSMLRDLVIPIQASDRGEPSLSNTVLLTLTSDGKDSCTNSTGQSPSTVYTISENSPINSTIGVLKVADMNESCIVTSQILSEPVRKEFYLDSERRIIALQVLDHERTGCHSMSVLHVQSCNDSMQHNITSVYFQQIQVLVTDQNDNAPVILYPNSLNKTIYFQANTPKNEPLAQVRASDLDGGENGRLTFSILDKDQYSYLRINKNTGEVYMVEDFPDDMGSVPVVIRVQDNGLPRLSTTAALWLVRNMTGAAPIINQPILDDNNLVLVLSIAVPCGFLIVVAITVTAVLLRRNICCHDDQKRNHINPTLDIKIKLANSGSISKGEQLDTICKELGLRMMNDVKSLDPEKELPGYSPVELTKTEHHSESIKPHLTNSASDASARPSLGTVSSRDSDSGCSADMSHSTTGSWSGQQLHAPVTSWSTRNPKTTTDLPSRNPRTTSDLSTRTTTEQPDLIQTPPYSYRPSASVVKAPAHGYIPSASHADDRDYVQLKDNNPAGVGYPREVGIGQYRVTESELAVSQSYINSNQVRQYGHIILNPGSYHPEQLPHPINYAKEKSGADRHNGPLRHDDSAGYHSGSAQYIPDLYRPDALQNPAMQRSYSYSLGTNRHKAPPPSHHNAPPLSHHNAPPPSHHNAPPPSHHNGPPLSHHNGPPLSHHNGPPLSHHNATVAAVHAPLSKDRGLHYDDSNQPDRVSAHIDQSGLDHDGNFNIDICDGSYLDQSNKPKKKVYYEAHV